MESSLSSALSGAVESTTPAGIAAREADRLKRSRELLGGRRVFKGPVGSRFEVHRTIVGGGLPYESLLFLIGSFKSLGEEDMVHVLGISGRTLRRQRETPDKPMPADLASKTWLFAETLAKAEEIFGGRQRAEEWMGKPALGLGGERPIELLQTLQGAELVNDFLGRLEYDVYS